MAITPFLAMTAAEMRNVSVFPPKVAWMACHFSPYSAGLSNLPPRLPPHSVLILDDSTPIHGQDPGRISAQLQECAETFDCAAILLDFQRPATPEGFTFIKHLGQALPCPVIISEYYAADVPYPVMLSPVRPSAPLEEQLRAWKGRDIWLEMGLTGEILTLTQQGCLTTPLSYLDTHIPGFSDQNLHCHYSVNITKNSASFTLWRTMEDWSQLLKDAESFGVVGAVGLYQELQQHL